MCCIIFTMHHIVKSQSDEGIHFETDSFVIVLNKARQEKKLVFIDAYARGCSPCKWMDKNTFINDTVGSFYNSNFINIKIDMGNDKGREIAKRYEVLGFPTFLFIDSIGTIVHRKSGSCQAQEFVSLGKAAMNPQERYLTLDMKYKSGLITDKEFVNYITIRSKSLLPIHKQMEEYDLKQNETNFGNNDNWTLLYSFVENINSRMFEHLIANRTIYYSKYGADSVNHIIGRVYKLTMSECLFEKEPNISRYLSLREEFIGFNLPLSVQTILENDVLLYFVTKDWINYVHATEMYVDKFAANDDYVLFNNFARVYYDYINDTSSIDIAITWAKKSVQIEAWYVNTCTYALLLYKRGNYTEALMQIADALKLADAEEITYRNEAEDLLKKIRGEKEK